MSQKNPWKVLRRRRIYDNPWITVVESETLHRKAGRGIYGTVHFKNLAIGILALDEQQHLWLVGQYRFPLGYYSWEIPEGGGRLDVSALVSAKRELREETGLRAKRWKRVLEMDLSNSVTDEKAILYLATGLTEGAPCPDPDEELTVKRIPFKRALQMVERGDIRDSLSVAGILKLAQLLKH